MARRRGLTKRHLDGLKPKAKRFEERDEATDGLVIRVTANGVKTWSVLYRSPATGRQVRMTIGRYPAVSLERARAKARSVRGQVAYQRCDPVREQRAEAARARAERTFAEVVEDYLEIHASGLASARNIGGIIRKHLVRPWGDRPVAEITRGDVHALLDKLKREGSLGAAREARKQASAIFSWAYDRELVPTNPAYRLRRDELNRRRQSRLLTDEELRAIWGATGEMAYPWGTAWRLILLTGCRRSEVARARWTEIDHERRALLLDSERHKSRRGHVVPLSDLAWDLLQSCPRFVGREAFILSTTHGRRPIQCFNKQKRGLDERLGEILGRAMPPWRTHDLRVAFRSRMSRLRIPREWAEACLGHAQPHLEKIYDEHDYEAEMREAMERYAEHVLEIVGEQACQKTRALA